MSFASYDGDSLARRQAEREAQVKRCLNDIHSPVSELRAKAARRLGELRSGYDALIIAFDDSNSFVREAAVEAIGYFPEQVTPLIVDRLLSAIDDNNDHICSAAIRSLGRLDVQESVPEILDCFNDKNPYVLGAAILAAADLRVSGISDKLIALLKSESSIVSGSAVKALAKLHETTAGPVLVEKLEYEIRKSYYADRSSALCKHIIQAVGLLQVREAVPLLIDIAQRVVGLREVAVTALIQLGDAKVAPILSLMLADPSPGLKTKIIRLLITEKYRAALPLIRPLIKDVSPQVRQIALQAITRWNDKESVTWVRQMCVDDGNPFVRADAIDSLAKLVGDNAYEDLLLFAKDVNVLVLQAVARNLGVFKGRSPEVDQTLSILMADAYVANKLQAGSGESVEDGVNESFSEPLPSLIPPELLPQVVTLTEILKAWHIGLPALAHKAPLTEITAIDSAIARLLVALAEVQPVITSND